MKIQRLATHDIGRLQLKIEAETLEKLFILAVKEMTKILKKDYVNQIDGHTFIRELSLSSPDTTTLLLNFLSTILTFSLTETVVFYDFTLLEITDNNLHTHIMGTKIDNFTKAIRGINYPELEINRNEKGNYETVLNFDL